ncbi:MAG: hypothetical protein M3Z13_04245 [Candidatus Dormibacteraeota bacterium]|nr:hypothetical protein [Candidatus Dormibacteraeota bacterium]
MAYFEGLSEEARRIQKDNSDRRFRAALTSQPGLHASFLLERPNGDVVAFTLWDSEEVMREGMRRANSVPLLPGQRGEDIPSPTRMEVLRVSDAFVAPSERGST